MHIIARHKPKPTSQHLNFTRIPFSVFTSKCHQHATCFRLHLIIHVHFNHRIHPNYIPRRRSNHLDLIELMVASSMPLVAGLAIVPHHQLPLHHRLLAGNPLKRTGVSSDQMRSRLGVLDPGAEVKVGDIITGSVVVGVVGLASFTAPPIDTVLGMFGKERWLGGGRTYHFASCSVLSFSAPVKRPPQGTPASRKGP